MLQSKSILFLIDSPSQSVEFSVHRINAPLHGSISEIWDSRLDASILDALEECVLKPEEKGFEFKFVFCKEVKFSI